MIQFVLWYLDFFATSKLEENSRAFQTLIEGGVFFSRFRSLARY